MRTLLNHFKKHNGYFFARQSSSVQDDYAISIIWQNTLVHIKLHKKNANSYYFEDYLHYHDSLEHAIDYFMKAYKNVVKPLSQRATKALISSGSSISGSRRWLSSSTTDLERSSPSPHGSSPLNLSSSSVLHPFNKGRSRTMHNKQKMLPAIEQKFLQPLVNKRVVVIHEEQLTFGKLLGEGNFGKVFSGEYREEQGSAVPVAIKALKTAVDRRSKDEMKKEAFVMKELSHPCIVRLYGIAQSRKLNSTLMVQELLPMGSLLTYLKAHLRKPIRALFGLWITQIIHGMAYMEKKRFVHRDLAARNILMQSRSRIKISDFGLSRSVDSNNYYIQQSDTPVPIAWYAPESLAHFKFTSKSDVWSFGITMWEIYTYGQYPYGSIPNEEVFPYISNGGRLPQPSGCSNSAYDIMHRCWTYDTRSRPSFPDLLKILGSRPEFVHAIQYFHSLSKF